MHKCEQSQLEHSPAGTTPGDPEKAAWLVEPNGLPSDPRLLDAAINSINEGLMITTADPDGRGPRIVYVNPAFTRITGYGTREILGQTPAVLTGPTPRATVLERMFAGARAGVSRNTEMFNCRKDGKQVLLAWRVVPVCTSSNRVTHCLCVLRDVTERRSAERLLRLQEQELARVARLSTLGEMAGAIGHELNQPLFAILNYAESCRRGLETVSDLPHSLLDDLHQISAAAERASEIIRRVRKLSSKREPCRSSTDLNLLVSDALKVIERDAQRDDVLVRVELAPSLPLVVTDSLLIQQVIMNLARNAIESLLHKAEHDRQLTIHTAHRDGNVVEVAIEDNGPGLKGISLDDIFMPFCTTKPHHVGLGLSLSQAIIQSEDGHLMGEPNTTGGMTFRFTLPIRGGDCK